MFSKLFGRGKKEEVPAHPPVPENASWAFLGADMHSHLIPGIDDGSKSIEDSLNMIRALKDMGYRTLITTPHVMVDYYPNTSQAIEDGLQRLREALSQNNIDISIQAAAEYYMDEYFISLLGNEPLRTIREKEVLVEFSMLYEPPMLFDVLYRMQACGYKPVIAHPERYLFFHQEFNRYQEFKNRGCLMQLNMLSIGGYYGKTIKMIAEKLLAKNLYDYCGSDMHHERHVAALKAMVKTKEYHTFVNYPFLNSRLCI